MFNPPEAHHASAGRYPARFARVAIFPAATPTSPIFSDYLDANGCTVLQSSVPNGAYTLLMFGRMQSGNINAIARDHKCNGAHKNELDLDSNCKCTTSLPYTWSLDGTTVSGNDYPQVDGLSFVVTLNTLPTGFTSGPAPDFASLTQDVAATYGQYLATANSGMLAAATYVGYANQVCPAVDTSTDSNGRCEEACANTPDDNAAYFGYNYTNATTDTLDLGSPNARVKFTVAHEVGHTIQRLELGGIFAEVFDINTGTVPEFLCRCDKLNDVGNTLHCLQSSNSQSTAQVEGFAQFSSANVWNDPTSSSCNFSYYKKIRHDDDFLTVTNPPNPVSCYTTPAAAPKWTENHCIHTARASEWDWMEYLTAIARDATAPISQVDLSSVYLRECFDENGFSNCQGASVLWTSAGANLPTAAAQVFGLNTPRYQTFNNDGAAYGVTR